MSKFKLTLVSMALVLSGCGGGGGGNVQEDNSFAPSAPRIEILPQNASLPANTGQFPAETNSPYLTPVTVRVLQNDGAVIPDGVLLFLRTNDIRSVALSPQTANSALALVDTTCVQSFGGRGTFLLHSGPQAGTVQLSASVTFPPQPGTISDNAGVRTCTQPFLNPGSQSYVGTLNYTVTAGPAPFERLSAVATRTTLPVNSLGTSVTSPTSPFVSEVEVTFRTIGGALVETGVANVSINPAIGRFSIPDDPATLQTNEFTTLFTQGQVNIRAGKAILYFHAGTQVGTTTLTLTVQDPTTGATVTKQITFTIGGVSGGLPSQVRITGDNRVVYTRGTNGNNDAPLQVTVTDTDGAPVADSSGAANLLLEILPVANGSGEVLAAAGVADGSTVRIRTIAGVGLATFRSGTRQGLVTVRATADRADNNVDNGVQNAVISQTSFVVSDGQLFDLEITGPIINAVEANGVVQGVDPIDFDVTGTPISIPPQLDGSYGLTVSVVATDRQGNPVLPNTPIEFGMIDEPMRGFPAEGAGQFTISGTDGDPQEGGSLFTSVSGRFVGQGGTGAGPGDTLIVFGEQSPGNRDLESARIVSRVNGSTSLTIQNRFNFNDDTGSSVNNGPVLPYIVGRNTTGNILSPALTAAPGTLANGTVLIADGVASTRMTYPVSALGKGVVVWARGSGDVVNGTAELVTDAEFARFPGIAPASLVVSPALIPANRTSLVSVCYSDALRTGIAGVFPTFAVIGAGQTTVDGVAGSGTVANATDRNGCTTVSINTLGVVVANNTSIVFSVGGLTGTVMVAGANNPVLQVIPSQLGGGGGQVLLRLLDGSGVPIPGIQLVGTCTASGTATSGFVVSLQTPPGVTNSFGETTAVIGANLDAAGTPGTGSCTFTTAGTGGPTAVVNLRGINVCDIVVSPLCPTAVRTQATLQVQLDFMTGPAVGVVTGNAGGINCSTGGPAGGCSGSVDVGTTIRLTAAPGTGSQFCGWSGAPECDTTTPVVTVAMTTSKICVARFRLSTSACSP